MTRDIRSTDILARVVAFPTIRSSRDSNLELIGFIRAFLLERGATVDIFPNADGTKASLYARVGEGGGGFLLSKHTDVGLSMGKPGAAAFGTLRSPFWQGLSTGRNDVESLRKLTDRLAFFS